MDDGDHVCCLSTEGTCTAGDPPADLHLAVGLCMAPELVLAASSKANFSKSSHLLTTSSSSSDLVLPLPFFDFVGCRVTTVSKVGGSNSDLCGGGEFDFDAETDK